MYSATVPEAAGRRGRPRTAVARSPARTQSASRRLCDQRSRGGNRSSHRAGSTAGKHGSIYAQQSQWARYQLTGRGNQSAYRYAAPFTDCNAQPDSGHHLARGQSHPDRPYLPWVEDDHGNQPGSGSGLLVSLEQLFLCCSLAGKWILASRQKCTA